MIQSFDPSMVVWMHCFSMLKQTTKSIKKEKWQSKKEQFPFECLTPVILVATLWPCVYILSVCISVRDFFEDVKNADKVILLPKMISN